MRKLLIASLFGATFLGAGGLYAGGPAKPVGEAAIQANAWIVLAQAVDEDDDDEDVQPDVQPGPNDQDDQEDIEDDGEDAAGHPVDINLG